MKKFIYICSFDEGAAELFRMEMRALFGTSTGTAVIESTKKIEPSRSPFMRGRLDVLFKAKTIEEIIEKAADVKLENQTFKVVFMKINDLAADEKIAYEQRLDIERKIGWEIEGEADMKHPDVLFGVIPHKGGWLFGYYQKSTAVFLNHVKKPYEYSTALSARDARAIANIAVPDPDGVRAVDPCCGIGTVLVEALSMGIHIDGRDINPLVVTGARANIGHFGFKGSVVAGDIAAAPAGYGAAIIDMPYDLCTDATPEQQQQILIHARRIADKAVVVTIDSIDQALEKAGFRITDRCVVKKGRFAREVLLCQ